MHTADSAKLAAEIVDEARLIELERNSIRIPSPTFQEGEFADFLANYLAELGL